MKSLFIEDMNWIDVEYLIKGGYRNIVIGLGVFEQYGPHLPLKTGILMLDIVNAKVAVKLGKTLVGPTLEFGLSENNLGFPGTITLGKTTFISVVMDYLFSLSKHGFENIILITSNEKNLAALQEYSSRIPEKFKHMPIILFTDYEKVNERLYSLAQKERITIQQAGKHAGEIDTSIMMNISPGLVKGDRLERGFLLNGENNVDLSDIRKISQNGIIGDSTKSNSRRGEQYLNSMVDVIVDFILKRLR